MNTERLSPRYVDIDLWDPVDILDAMIEGQLSSVAAVRAARPAIEQAALAMETRLQGERAPEFMSARGRPVDWPCRTAPS